MFRVKLGSNLIFFHKDISWWQFYINSLRFMYYINWFGTWHSHMMALGFRLSLEILFLLFIPLAENRLSSWIPKKVTKVFLLIIFRWKDFPGPCLFWEKFSISNNRASDKPHWLWYCHCAKLGPVFFLFVCFVLNFFLMFIYFWESKRQSASSR